MRLMDLQFSTGIAASATKRSKAKGFFVYERAVYAFISSMA